MNRRLLLARLGGAVLAAALPALPVLAQDVGTQIAEQLRSMGYGEISVSSTLLGRLRITATRNNRRREIVVNPNSGEILRDISTDIHTGRAASGILDNDDNGADRDDRAGGRSPRQNGLDRSGSDDGGDADDDDSSDDDKDDSSDSGGDDSSDSDDSGGGDDGD